MTDVMRCRYVHCARAAKHTAGAPPVSVRCVLPWEEPKTVAELEALSVEEVAADLAAGGWKARALSEQLERVAVQQTVVVVGHSSGGTAALRMAERLTTARPDMTLVVVGAGYSAQDYESDRQARAQVLMIYWWWCTYFLGVFRWKLPISHLCCLSRI
eukprot:COSAG01_NODE_1800_length_9205_cov_18.778058_10_plen_158_part_00